MSIYHAMRENETRREFVERAAKDAIHRMNGGESEERAIDCTTTLWSVERDELEQAVRDAQLSLVADALPRVWDSIAYDWMDVADGNTIKSAEFVEACVDADRLKTFGFNDAYAASKRLLKEMTWPEFCKAVSKKLPYEHWGI